MRIAMFASAYHPSLGGVEEIVRQLASVFHDEGHQPVILTNRWPRDLPAHERLDGIDVHRIAFRSPTDSWRSKATYLATTRLARRETVAVLRAHGSEVVHVQCISTNGYYARHAARALGLPLVVTTQGELTMDASGIFTRDHFARRFLGDLARDADRFTACSAHTLADMEAFLGVRFGDRGAVILNGVDAAGFGGAEPWPRARPYVLALGRLQPQKGFDLLLEAFAAADPDLDLVLAGEGPERDALAARTEHLGLTGRVELFGRADRATTARLMKGAAFVVLPSRADEGLPLVALEAMAAGRALLATRTGGIEEAVTDGVHALLVDKGDVAALTAGIVRLADDVGLRERLGAAAGLRARDFSWTTVGRRYLEVFAEALATRAR